MLAALDPAVSWQWIMIATVVIAIVQVIALLLGLRGRP